MLDRPFGVRRARRAAAPIERAAPLRPAAPVDDAAPLFRHAGHGVPPRLGPAVRAGAAIGPESGKGQEPARVWGFGARTKYHETNPLSNRSIQGESPLPGIDMTPFQTTQSDPPPAVSSATTVVARRAATPPVIDGNDNDEVWRTAQVIKDFRQ